MENTLMAMGMMEHELGPVVNLTRMDLRDWKPAELPEEDALELGFVPGETLPPPAPWKTAALFTAAFGLCAVVGMAWAWGATFNNDGTDPGCHKGRNGGYWCDTSSGPTYTQRTGLLQPPQPYTRSDCVFYTLSSDPYAMQRYNGRIPCPE